MPATPFNATAHRLSTIAVQTLRALDAEVLTELQGEDFLLITSCLRAGTSERLQEVDKNGNLVLDIHFNQKLTYAITARVLEFEGLADFHPGRALNDRLLSFANGRRAFQFKNDTGKLIYLDPRQTLAPGDLPTVEFTIEHLFVDLDTAEYPNLTTVSYSDLPAQASVEIPLAAKEAVLKDVFHGTSLCAGALTATLYDGDPAGAGSPQGSEISAAWATVSAAPGDDETWLAECPEILWEGTSGVRSITHIRLARPGLVCLDVALAAPQSVAAYYILRAAAADLVASLTWQWDGDGDPDRPAGFALRHLLGDATTGITPSAVMTVECWDGDPDAAGVLLDSFTVDRDAATWLVSGSDYVSNQVNLIGSTLAEAGGWTIEYVTVKLSGVDSWFIKKAGTIVIPEASPVTIPIGALDVDLA